MPVGTSIIFDSLCFCKDFGNFDKLLSSTNTDTRAKILSQKVSVCQMSSLTIMITNRLFTHRTLLMCIIPVNENLAMMFKALISYTTMEIKCCTFNWLTPNNIALVFHENNFALWRLNSCDSLSLSPSWLTRANYIRANDPYLMDCFVQSMCELFINPSCAGKYGTQ